MKPITDEERQAWRERAQAQRLAMGLPATVSDPVVIARIADIIRAAQAWPQPSVEAQG